MSEEAGTEDEKIVSEEAGAGHQTYNFINDDQMLRCFVFEVVTTHCQSLYEVSELQAIYTWVREGYTDGRLKLVKKD